MSTTITSGDMILSADAPTFPVSAIKLAEMRTKCLAMKVAGINDVEGFKIADRARMDVKADRCAVQNRAKDLKKQISEWSKTNIDAPADVLIAELATIEKYLESQTEPVDTERKRLKTEAEEKKKRDAEAKLAGRVAALVACRVIKNPIELATLTDEQFAEFLDFCQRQDATRREQEAADQRKRDADAAELVELRKLKDEQAKAAAVNQPAGSAYAPAPVAIPQQSFQPAMNATKSRPTTAIPMPAAPITPVESSSTNRDRDRRRLLEFADYVEMLTIPSKEALSVNAINCVGRALEVAASTIRQIVNESLPEVVAVAATDETEVSEVSVDDI